MKNIIKYLLISLISIITLIIGASLFIAYFYEQQVTEYLIKELNKNINTRINVKNHNFSVLRKFPNASLEFINVVALSTSGFNKEEFKDIHNTDTLLSAKSLFLQFNIIDIFKKNYKITKIHIDNGKAQILIDTKGQVNYLFWKKSTSPDFKLELQDLQFTNMQFRFINQKNNIDFKAYTNHTKLSGNFSADKYSLQADAKMLVAQFLIDTVNYLHNSSPVDLKLGLYVDNDEYYIKKGRLNISEQNLDLKGKFIAHQTNYIDLIIKGNDLDVGTFLSLLPEQFQKYINEYSCSGNFNFLAQIIGEFGDLVETLHATSLQVKKSPHIKVKFGVKDGEISKDNSNITLSDISLEGFYSNGKLNNSGTSYMKLYNFKTSLENSKITGKCRIKNFSAPEIYLLANADVDLNELQNFIQLDTIENIDGNLITEIKFKGKIKALNKFTAEDFRNSKTKGTLVLKQVNLNLKNNSHQYSNINGKFTFNNNDIKIDSLSLNILENDFYIQGYLKNILSYLIVEDQMLFVSADIQSSNLNFDDFLYNRNSPSESRGRGRSSQPEDTNTININLPDDIYFKLGIDIENFTFSKFQANKVKGKLNYKSKKLLAKSVIIESIGGTIQGDGEIYQLENNNLIIRVFAQLNDIDIQKLFYTFNNFGQDFIQDKHLKGALSGDVMFSSEWTNNLSCNKEKIFAENCIEISNGELINFEPMMNLSSYIKVSELKHIRFSTLKNEILINNGQVTIPQMEINSSAFNISLSGTHSFDNIISYKIKVLLSDVLSKKARKAKKENQEFGVIEDDGLGRTSLYLSISGTGDDYKISYDRKKALEAVRQNLIEEKHKIKAILHEKFGWFKKDSSIINNKKNNNKANNQRFIIVWDEDAPEEKDMSDEEDY